MILLFVRGERQEEVPSQDFGSGVWIVVGNVEDQDWVTWWLYGEVKKGCKRGWVLAVEDRKDERR